MSAGAALQDLRRALQISREVAALADHGDVARALQLTAERLSLLQAARRRMRGVDAESGALLQEIANLNARSIGLLEHRRRGKARELDTVAAGRRAVCAYSATRPGR